jgi:hypothetical protein
LHRVQPQSGAGPHGLALAHWASAEDARPSKAVVIAAPRATLPPVRKSLLRVIALALEATSASGDSRSDKALDTVSLPL